MQTSVVLKPDKTTLCKDKYSQNFQHPVCNIHAKLNREQSSSGFIPASYLLHDSEFCFCILSAFYICISIVFCEVVLGKVITDKTLPFQFFPLFHLEFWTVTTEKGAFLQTEVSFLVVNLFHFSSLVFKGLGVRSPNFSAEESWCFKMLRDSASLPRTVGSSCSLMLEATGHVSFIENTLS